jgi:hypothetical protein
LDAYEPVLEACWITVVLTFPAGRDRAKGAALVADQEQDDPARNGFALQVALDNARAVAQEARLRRAELAATREELRKSLDCLRDEVRRSRETRALTAAAPYRLSASGSASATEL